MELVLTRKIAGYLFSASGTSIPAVGYIIVAGISAGHETDISIFLLIVSYVSATASLLGHITGPIFLKSEKSSRNVYQIIFANIVILTICSIVITIYNYYGQFISFYYLLAALLVSLSQIICPFWYVLRDRFVPQLFSVLSIFRTFTFVLIATMAQLQYIAYERGVFLFAIFCIITSLISGGASNLISISRRYKYNWIGSLLYFKEIKSLVISQQMNLFVAYLMPLINLKYIDPINLQMFFIFERMRYIALSVANSFYVYWQRIFIENILDINSLKKWRLYVVGYSACFVTAAIIAIFLLWDNSVLSDYDALVGLSICMATLLGVMGSYLSNVEFVVLKDYNSILRANAVSLAMYVSLGVPLVILYGALGLAVATVGLEFSLLVQLQFKLITSKKFAS